MKARRFWFLHLAAAAIFSTTLCGGSYAWSQTARTIKIIVPFAPGGAVSVVARSLAEELSRTHGVTIVIENQPGAGTAIATETVARAAPDGNTLLITISAILINSHLRKQNYDPFKSFEPICELVHSPTFIAVNSASPYHTLANFIDAARDRPGELTSAGNFASAPHIAFEALKRKANVNITFVPYVGSSTMVTALLGGHVTSTLDNYATMAPHVSAGTLRALATFSGTRVENLPHVPTVAEYGYNELEGWFGLFAPAHVPKEAVSQLSAWVSTAMQTPEMKRRLEPLGLYPTKMCGEEFASLLHKQYDELGRIIRDANIKAE